MGLNKAVRTREESKSDKLRAVTSFNEQKRKRVSERGTLSRYKDMVVSLSARTTK